MSRLDVRGKYSTFFLAAMRGDQDRLVPVRRRWVNWWVISHFWVKELVRAALEYIYIYT